MRNWIVYVVLACASVATAAPRVSAKARYKAAVEQHTAGNYQQALQLIEQGLAVAPKDLQLLGLKGTVLLEMRDYPHALVAYQVYLKAKPTRANQRQVEKIVESLLVVESTFLDLTLANGPASIYLDSKTQGVFCQAAPVCNQAVLPGDYKLIVERPGFEPWSNRVQIEAGKVTKLAVTLVETPSLLTVRVQPPGARVTVDGAAHDAPGPIPAGTHRVEVALAGYAEVRREVSAHEGKPVELDVALTPIVPIRVVPPGAELLMDGAPVTIRAGGLAIPPGTHVLVARAPGFQDREVKVPAERAAGYQLELVLASAPVAEVAEASSSAPGRFTLERKLALVVGGVGLVAVGAGVLRGVQSGRLADDGKLETDQRRRSLTLQSEIAYGAGGVALAIAIVMWFDGAPGTSGTPGTRVTRVTVAPRLGPIAGLDLSLRF